MNGEYIFIYVYPFFINNEHSFVNECHSSFWYTLHYTFIYIHTIYIQLTYNLVFNWNKSNIIMNIYSRRNYVNIYNIVCIWILNK